MAAPGRKAARLGAKTTCTAHEQGLVYEGKFSVLIHGGAAACMNTRLLCDGGNPGVIYSAETWVLAEGAQMARQFDLCGHLGLIVDGVSDVQIGTPSDEEWIALGILRIKLSQFGQTAEGKAIVAQLEKMQSDGRIDYAQPESTDDAAQYDPMNRTIKMDPNTRGDVDATASDLTHEGTHAYDDRNRPDSTPPPDPRAHPENEYHARDNEQDLYEEQRGQGYRNSDNEYYRNPSTRRERINERYGYGKR